jgi:AhpD family alkylhydroperoxidase
MKQLIAVAVAHVTQCPYCIQVHTKAARRAGATAQELIEAVWGPPRCGPAEPLLTQASRSLPWPKIGRQSKCEESDLNLQIYSFVTSAVRTYPLFMSTDGADDRQTCTGLSSARTQRRPGCSPPPMS